MQEHHDGTWIMQWHATVKTNASMGMLVKASDVPNERASAAHQLVIPILGFIMKINCHLHKTNLCRDSGVSYHRKSTANPDVEDRDLRFASFEATPRNYARASKDEKRDWKCGANSGICICPSQHHYISRLQKNTNMFLRWYG